MDVCPPYFIEILGLTPSVVSVQAVDNRLKFFSAGPAARTIEPSERSRNDSKSKTKSAAMKANSGEIQSVN
jgi:hypothetical protein